MHNTGNHKQNKKTIYGVRDKLCKSCDKQELISKVCKQLIQLNIKKKPIQKMGKDLNKHFIKEEIQWPTGT